MANYFADVFDAAGVRIGEAQTDETGKIISGPSVLFGQKSVYVSGQGWRLQDDPNAPAFESFTFKLNDNPYQGSPGIGLAPQSFYSPRPTSPQAVLAEIQSRGGIPVIQVNASGTRVTEAHDTTPTGGFQGGLTGFFDGLVQSFVNPFEQLSKSTVKVFTNPGKANFGDYFSALNPGGATIVSDVKHPKDALYHLGIAAGVGGGLALASAGAGTSAGAGAGAAGSGGFFSSLGSLGATAGKAILGSQALKKAGTFLGLSGLMSGQNKGMLPQFYEYAKDINELLNKGARGVGDVLLGPDIASQIRLKDFLQGVGGVAQNVAHEALPEFSSAAGGLAAGGMGGLGAGGMGGSSSGGLGAGGMGQGGTGGSTSVAPSFVFAPQAAPSPQPIQASSAGGIDLTSILLVGALLGFAALIFRR